MKKEVIVCDKCQKELGVKTAVYITVFTKSGDIVTGRADFCSDCCQAIFNAPTEKGGEQ